MYSCHRFNHHSAGQVSCSRDISALVSSGLGPGLRGLVAPSARIPRAPAPALEALQMAASRDFFAQTFFVDFKTPCSLLWSCARLEQCSVQMLKQGSVWVELPGIKEPRDRWQRDAQQRRQHQGASCWQSQCKVFCRLTDWIHCHSCWTWWTAGTKVNNLCIETSMLAQTHQCQTSELLCVVFVFTNLVDSHVHPREHHGTGEID